jgi:peptidoglycan hydrolase CwlO-like protein
LEQPQLNPEFIIQSLQIQLSEAHLRIAERDALITEYYQKIQELEKELAALKEKVKQ